MFFSIIVAIGNQNQLGLNNKIPWLVKDDLLLFKNITINHSVVFGRKTYESIGHPLPNRNNIVLTKNKDIKINNCIVLNSINEVINITDKEKEVFICGGADIYNEILNKYSHLVNKLYISHINYNGNADIYFPEIDYNNYKIIKEQYFQKSLNNEYDFIFKEYMIK